MQQLTTCVFILINYLCNHSTSATYQKIDKQDALKINAFNIIKVNCNSCHAVKRKTTVFTLENIDSYASIINQQVFIKKRMPKGRKNRLTKVEEETLHKWIIFSKEQ